MLEQGVGCFVVRSKQEQGSVLALQQAAKCAMMFTRYTILDSDIRCSN